MAIKTTMNLLPEERLHLEKGVEYTSFPSAPLMSYLLGPSGRVEQAEGKEFTWREEDRLPISNADGVKEVSSYEPETMGPRKVRSNFCQIFRKTVAVSDTMNATNVHGVGSQLNKDLSQARDIVMVQAERQFLYGIKKDEDEFSGRQSDGIANMVGYTLDLTPAEGAERVSLTKDDFEHVLKQSYERGYIGKKTVILNSNQKKVIDAIYGNNGVMNFKPGENVMGDAMATIVRTPYGDVDFMVDINMPQDEIYIVDLNKIVLKRLQAFDIKDVSSPNVSAVAKAFEGQYGLKLESRFHAGKIIGLKA